MPTFKNRLEVLLADVVLASGLKRTQALEVVRTYIRTTDVNTLRNQLSQITQPTELRAMQAAGVPLELQAQFLTQVSQYLP